MIATFVGKTDRNFENGKEYVIKLPSNKSMMIRKGDDEKVKCKYESLSAFLRNWNNIKVIRNK